MGFKDTARTAELEPTTSSVECHGTSELELVTLNTVVKILQTKQLKV